MTFIRAYLRASTQEQDAKRARGELEQFAADRGLKVAAWYIENESGAKLERPELFRLLADASEGDTILLEQVDRLSRLSAQDWETLKGMLAKKRLRVVALDLPTSWMAATANMDETTAAILSAVNAMMLDMLAAIARKDYQDRRRRQAQGIAKAKEQGKFTGRKSDTDRHALIVSMIDKGMSWTEVCKALGCSLATVKRALDSIKTGVN